MPYLASFSHSTSVTDEQMPTHANSSTFTKARLAKNWKIQN